MALVFGLNALGTTVLAGTYFDSVSANLLLELLALTAGVGARFGATLHVLKEPITVNWVVTKTRSFVAFGMLSATVSLFATVTVVGARVSDLTSLNAISQVAHVATLQRYGVGLSFPIYYNIANALVLTYSILATCHCISRRRVEWTFAPPILIYIVANLLITTRAPILYMFTVMIFTGIFVAREVSATRQFPKLASARLLQIFGILGAGVAGIFFYFESARFGTQNAQSSSDLWLHLRRWPWGSLPGFSMWRDGMAGQTPAHHVGYYTFMGLFDNLGIEPRTDGGFADYVTLAPGEIGNIYTVFRGSFLDYGIAGTFLFIGILGFLGGLAVSGKYLTPVTGMAIYVAVMSFFAWAIVISFWAFTANVVALAIAPLAFRFFTGTIVPANVQSSPDGTVVNT